MNRLAKYLATRAAKALIVVVVIAIFNFFLIRMAPGDPAQVMAGESGSADAVYVEQLRQEFGLDKPLGTQLGIYLRHLAQLDLGYSHRQNQTVADLISDRLPATLLLTGCAFFLALALGVTLGVMAARRVGTWTDTLITVGSLLAYATPIFWIGLMLILLFSVQLEWLPAYGMNTVGENLTGLAYAVDVGKHLLLPTVTLALFYMAIYARLTRASILEVIQMDFVKTARAKGMPEGTIIRRHVLRNALLPVITYAGIQAGSLIGGSILIETVFAWPGIGRMAFEAVVQRDYSVMLGIFFVTSVVVVAINLVTDIVYSVVDPRIELK
jgi:peptide/nickel transport system permease protein